MAVLGEASDQAGIEVLGIPGSLQPDSWSACLLRAADEVNESVHVSPVATADLRDLPPFEPGDGHSPSVQRLRSAVERADAVLVSTPEYNGSLPGGLKNAIDWVATPDREGPIRSKPVAVVGADRAPVGCAWACADARKVLEVAGARVVSESLAIDAAEEAFDETGRLASEELEAQLALVLDDLRQEASAP